MKRKRWRIATAGSLLMLCLTFGCGCEDDQLADGRPCEVGADDCPEGYTCARNEETEQGAGICVRLTEADAGSSADAGATDALATDTCVPRDAAQADTARIDAAQPDAARTDAAQPDTAGTDAAQPDGYVPTDATQPDIGETDAAQPDGYVPTDAARPDSYVPTDAARSDTAVTDATPNPRLVGWQRSQLVPLGMDSTSNNVRLRGRLLSGFEQDSSAGNITLRGRIIVPADQN